MHFEIELDQRLSAAIHPSYDVGNYTGAIVAAVQLLSDVIRNKSGLDSDGQPLAGQAFGGVSPIIKINAIRTESDKDEQKGIELLLRGIYTGIRNPRSHELKQDSAETANAIITFVNWMIRVIDGSKSPFDPEDIIERVLDDHFLPTAQYGKLIADEVPPRIRLDVLTRLVDKVSFAKALNAQVFIAASLLTMNDVERDQFWSFMSNKLISSNSDAELMALVRVSAQHWSRCSEIARLRTENRLIKSIRDGRVDSEGRVAKGWVGVRIREIESTVLMKAELHKTLSDKLLSYDSAQRDYIYKYFMEALARLEPIPLERTVKVLNYRLSAQDSETYRALELLTAADDTNPWYAAVKDAFVAFQFKDEDIPF